MNGGGLWDLTVVPAQIAQTATATAHPARGKRDPLYLQMARAVSHGLVGPAMKKGRRRLRPSSGFLPSES